MKKKFGLNLFLNVSVFTLFVSVNPFLILNEGGIKETWEFYSVVTMSVSEESIKTGSHKLGKEVAGLYTTFMEICVVKEKVSPGDPAHRTVIRKPAIYKAVMAIEKEFNRAVKNNTITVEEAAEKFIQILKVALAAMDANCESFENALQKHKKDVPTLMTVFSHVTLKY